MATSMYDFSVPVFLRGLRALSALLDRAASSDLSEAELMQARLAPDMKPFPDQVRFAAFAGRSCVARLTGQPWPVTADDEADLAQLKATVDLSIAFIEAADPAAFSGAETREVELRFPGVELDFVGAGYLSSFAIPNFYFHVTTAYALLRQSGLPIGKVDFLGQLALTRPPKLG
jgi:hypothetical protein